jgi:protocatechuate 3,4-dioxygenase beta subunit
VLVQLGRIAVVTAVVAVACNGDRRIEHAAPATTEATTPLAPGQPLELRVRVRHADGQPATHADVRVYQTDAEGYYRKGSDGAELGGDQARVAYLVRTDDGGRFVVRTIVPGRYPTGGPPPHVHFNVPPDDRAHDLTVMLDTDGALDRDHIARMARTWIGHVRVEAGRAVCDVEITAPGSPPGSRP